MEIRITEIEPPFFNSFTVFAKINLDKLIKEPKLTIVASKVSKTRVATSVKYGEAQKGINWKVEKFKTVEKHSMSFADYEPQVHHYFISSKKQNKQVYFEYIKKVIEEWLWKSGTNIYIEKLDITFHDRFKEWK
jgi:hypothetical protein